MPMEDAINLVARNFELYMKRERGNFGGPAFDKHPEAIQTLLNLLQQNRQLTVLQYDKIIRYLSEKRELQVKVELGDSKGVPPVITDPNLPPAKQAELQNRILNILKNKTGGPNSEPAPAPVPAPSPWGGNPGPAATGSSTAPPLLNDPTVQKALDNLIQGDLLRKLPGAPAPVPPPQPLFGAYGPGRKY